MRNHVTGTEGVEVCHHLLSAASPHPLSSPFSGQRTEAQTGKSLVFPRLPRQVVIGLGSEPHCP